MPDDQQQTVEIPEDFAAFERYREGRDDEPIEGATSSAAADKEPPAKTAPDSDPDKVQEPEGEKHKGLQKRFDKITKEKGDLARENEELKRKLEESNQGSRPAQDKNAPPQKAEEAVGDGKPTLDKYETLEAFYEALADWKLDQREKTKAATAEADKAKESAAAAQKVWNDRETTFKAEHADYDGLIDEVQIPKTASVPAIQQALIESEIGPAILYDLAKNPDELKRIAGLSPASAVKEIGKIEARLAEKKAPEKPQQKLSNAPPPAARVGERTASAGKSIDDPDIPFAEFEKKREAQLRRRR